jgi:hypothetical protein
VCAAPHDAGEIKAKVLRLGLVDEGRKRVLPIAASKLAARNLAHLDSDRPSPAFEAAIGSAIHTAERIMRKIDSQ